jgi:organic radical activating enzyme
MDAAKAKSSVDPRRYFEGVRTDSDQPEHDPVCLYLETTNRCNLLCTTCPRTYEELEPPADMSWQLFCSIVDQIPNLSRAVLHGVGEPMLVKNLPRMVRYLKDRGTYVLFNTNGTVLNEKNGRALIEAELDELRVSFDAANAESYKVIRGKNYFNRILRNVRAFRDLQEREGHASRGCRRGSRACAKPSSNCRNSFVSRRKPAFAKSICSGWCSSERMPLAWRARIRRCMSSSPARRRATSIARPRSPLRSASASAPPAPPRSRE